MVHVYLEVHRINTIRNCRFSLQKIPTPFFSISFSDFHYFPYLLHRVASLFNWFSSNRYKINAKKNMKQTNQTRDNQSAFSKANLLSRLVFHWVTPLLLLGRRRELVSDDLPDIGTNEDCGHLADRLTIHWEAELAHRTRKNKLPRLWLACVKALRYRIIMAGTFCVTSAIARILSTFMLSMTIQSIQQTDSALSKSFAWGIGLILAMMLHTLLYAQYQFASSRLGFRAQTGMITMLYRKALKLPTTALTHSGQIVNLVSNDTSSFLEMARLVHYLWVSPLVIIFSIVGLYLQLGWPAFVGLAIYTVSGPLQGFLLEQYMKICEAVSEVRDVLVSRIGDLLEGIEVIKLYAWETPFETMINRERDEQSRHIRNDILNFVAFIGIVKATTYMMTLGTFLTYFALGNELDASKVFTSMSLFEIISEALDIQLVDAIHRTKEIQIALRRIARFLLLPELESDTNCDSKQPSTNETTTTTTTNNNNDDDLEQFLFIFKNVNIGWESTKQLAFLNEEDDEEDGEGDASSNEKKDKDITTSSQESKEPFKLTDINLSIRKHQLLTVVGPTGSGKTTFCMALLQELKPQCGNLLVGAQDNKDNKHSNNGNSKLRVAYASQQPWVLSGTVRDNILFEQPYEQERYRNIISACALDEDLKALPFGDSTFIGERGITLSGGQRARISLARAVYAQADLYVLDDPLSAVDPRVARHLHDQVICGLLKDTSCILVTHQLQFAQHADQIIMLDQGRIQLCGTPHELAMNLETLNDKETSAIFDEFTRELARYLKSKPEALVQSEESKEDRDDSNEVTIRKTPTHFSSTEADGRAMEEEEASGSIPLSTYWALFKAGAPSYIILLSFIVFGASEGILAASSWTLAQWTELSREEQAGSRNDIRYAVLVATGSVVFFAGNAFIALIIINANRSIFRRMLHSILAAPMHFFHINPHGRILNRFSKDQANSDIQLPISTLLAIQGVFNTASTIIVACIVSPFSLIALSLAGVGLFLTARLFMPANRQIKRIESTARSPVYSQLSESLYGLITIRAYNAQADFFNRFVIAQNRHSRAYFAYIGATTWRSLYIDFCAWIFAITVILVSIGGSKTLEAGFVGLALNQVITLLLLLQWTVSQCVEVEMEFVSVERILEYTKLPSEPPRHMDPPPPPDWPSKGEIEFSNATLVYPGTEKPALSNVTFDVKAGEKIGIVGRTGAGKSSLLAALFRLAELESTGSITIDGIPISSIGVHDIRSRITIIPQSPILFRGSVRFNLDPLEKYTDNELWDALKIAGLYDKITCFSDKLDTIIGEHGESFSMGEKQLVSLARAILRNTKIVVLDEATANVDTATDQRIQRAIRQHFDSTTVLTIAHRLDTVIGIVAAAYNNAKVTEYGQRPCTKEEDLDVTTTTTVTTATTSMNDVYTTDSDRVLVMHHGRVYEYGPPDELLLKQQPATTSSPSSSSSSVITTADNDNAHSDTLEINCGLRAMVLDIGQVGQMAIKQLEEQAKHI